MLIPFRPDAHLVLLQERHAEEVFALVDEDREHLAEWLPWVEAQKGPDDTRAFIRASLDRFAREGSFQLALVWGDRVVGAVGLHAVDRANGRTEVGYWLARKAQGRGLMTQAVRAVCDHLFHEMRLHRVEIRCAPANVRSRAIPERLGFAEEGVLREVEWVSDHWEDAVVYGMLADEWRARRG